MKEIDLRQAIVMRVQDNSAKDLSEVIEDSIGADERALPGLGVLFEMIWQQSTELEQERMVDSLYRHLHHSEHANPSQ
ncbi:small acid-soluble spore protein SspI [Paenibacillus sp. MCAF9]|uniref:small acid-soluble spore protein SspI n=1 Tax=unclassified Paenibacillus TaxID=185978 RepID=UPI00118709E6|nr:small acid-soluble spore protein SspI [Paenibacillus sp. FSL A5-0031]